MPKRTLASVRPSVSPVPDADEATGARNERGVMDSTIMRAGGLTFEVAPGKSHSAAWEAVWAVATGRTTMSREAQAAVAEAVARKARERGLVA